MPEREQQSQEPGPAAVILAAGRSSRMGQPKALIPWNGRPALQALAETLSGCSPLVLVVRTDCDWLEPSLASRFRVVRNPDPERGMLSSIQCGVTQIGPPETPLFVTPVDCPGFAPATVAALLAARARHPGRTVLPTWQGQAGHPVLLGLPAMDAVLAADPRRLSLREVLAGLAPPPLRLEVPDPAILDNLNTPADLAHLSGPGPAAAAATESRRT